MPHTPGPLNISRHATPEHSPQFGIYSEANPHKDIAIITGENAEADAHLMKASPQMLDALVDCEGVLDSANRHTNGTCMAFRLVLEKVRAAIAETKP